MLRKNENSLTKTLMNKIYPVMNNNLVRIWGTVHLVMEKREKPSFSISKLLMSSKKTIFVEHSFTILICKCLLVVSLSAGGRWKGESGRKNKKWKLETIRTHFEAWELEGGLIPRRYLSLSSLSYPPALPPNLFPPPR